MDFSLVSLTQNDKSGVDFLLWLRLASGLVTTAQNDKEK